tara:strand:+ start:206 stop:328 length:123 start_codon:yes stop_codon:yes gene_type:complete
LVHVKELANLRYLYLGGTQLADAGIAELQKVLPNCDCSRT